MELQRGMWLGRLHIASAVAAVCVVVAALTGCYTTATTTEWQSPYQPTAAAYGAAPAPADSATPAGEAATDELTGLILDLRDLAALAGEQYPNLAMLGMLLPLDLTPTEEPPPLLEVIASIHLRAGRFAAILEATPTDSGAQLGLALCSLVMAFEEAGQRSGLSLSPPAATLALAVTGDPQPLRAAAAAPIRAAAHLLDLSAKGARSPVSAAQADEVDPSDLWAAFDVLLGWFGSETLGTGILGRLASVAELEGPVAVVSPDGYPVPIVPQQVQSLLAALESLRSGLLIVTAYSPEAGEWVMPPITLPGLGAGDVLPLATVEEPTWDLNGDGILTPAEYLPPDPFAALVADGIGRLGQADASIGLAVHWFQAAATPPETGESTEVAQLPGGDLLVALAGELDAMRHNTVPIRFVGLNAETGEFDTLNLPVTLQPLLAGQLADLKDLAPNLFGNGNGEWTPGVPPDLTMGGLIPAGLPLGIPGVPYAIGDAVFDATPVVGPVTAEPSTLAPGEQSTLTVSVFDPLRAGVTASWLVWGDRGTISGEGTTVTYTAPSDVAPEGETVSIAVDVTGATGQMAETGWATVTLTP